MNIYTTDFQNIETIQAFITENKLTNYKHVHIQLLLTEQNKEIIYKIKNIIPHATVHTVTVKSTDKTNKTVITCITSNDTPIQYTVHPNGNLLETNDNSYWKSKYESLIHSEQKLRSLFENNSDIVFATDLLGNITDVNEVFQRVLGYKKEDILHKNALHFLNEKDVKLVKSHFVNSLKGNQVTYELNISNKHNVNKTFLMKNIPIIVQKRKIGIFVIGKDITEQKIAEKKIAYLASYDMETGLPNKWTFNQKLEEELINDKSLQKAIIVIDLDRFKFINSSLGHEVGDYFLKIIVSRLKMVIPPEGYFARFGGDKFTLLVTSVKSVDEVIQLSQSILSKINEPLTHRGKEYYVSASIGISIYPNDGKEKESLLRNGDTALNRAKQQGGNKIKFFSADMNEQALFKMELEGYLRKALQKDEFFLTYQPFINFYTGEIIGAESLIRWDHPKLGLVSPLEFIPLAEETGLILNIGNWVLQTACEQAKKWQEKGAKDFTISVNVSAVQFQGIHFVEEVKEVLEKSGLQPKYLKLELTESVMLQNVQYSIGVMKELQKLGVQISIDDFGTVYSSLSYLKDLPANNLKIDRSFIQNLHANTKDMAIVRAIVAMSKGLDLKVIAEGIEQQVQWQLLKEMGCDFAQGYYISKPLSAKQFETFLATGTRTT